MEECSRASEEERITFPQVVGALMTAGVERYQADLVRAEKVYYMPGGESLAVSNRALAAIPAYAFSAAGIESALRDIQGGAIKYREFCARIAAAGCIGYAVFLTGRRAIYYGRRGDFHVEHFPGSGS
jgi:uncharacterized protein YbcV (DUF1398 family)